MQSPRKCSLIASLQKETQKEQFHLLLLVVLLAPSAARLCAQSASPVPEPAAQSDGIQSGGYLIHSSIDLGYRYNNVIGSDAMYDTLVNLQTGPRFLDQTLSMHSLDHQGVLFDDLSLNSFGWGGDPNTVLRLRAGKHKWYNLQGSYRRDLSYFNYDLLANPLNPPSALPSVPVLNSPHEFDNTGRRMTDIDLAVLPESTISFRLGYSHNNMTGPAFSSLHEGTEALLMQGWNTTMNSFRFGVDWRVLPRTVLSYDQSLNYYKGDTDSQLAVFNPALLPGGGSVELGLSFDPANNVPCAVKPPATGLIGPGGTLTNVSCSGYFNYLRNQRVRTSTPTERVSLRSNYFQWLDVVASYSYSDANMNTPLYESFNGLISRTGTRAFLGTGTADASQISNVLDIGVTAHLTKHLRLLEKYYLWAFRIPENANFNEIDNNCLGPCTLLTSLSATTPTTVNTLTQASFNQTWQKNQTELAWDISKKVGVRAGIRFGDQVFNHFNDFLPGDLDNFVVHEYTALMGFWARPSRKLRMNLDLELTDYDNVIFRMMPRKESRYRFQTTYTPLPWVVLGGSLNILQDSNNDTLTNYVGHNRDYGVTASIAPNERLGIDLAYNYNDIIQNALICFSDTPPIGVTLPFVNNATSCAVNDPTNPLLANSYYINHTNFGMGTVRFRPAKRVTANLGLSITNVDGAVPQLNFLQPQGAAEYKYVQPVVNLSVNLGHGMSWNTGWNYYQYAEGAFVGPTASRYFHANSLTESLRYAF